MKTILYIIIYSFYLTYTILWFSIGALYIYILMSVSVYVYLYRDGIRAKRDESILFFIGINDLCVIRKQISAQPFISEPSFLLCCLLLVLYVVCCLRCV